ncbi:MAG: Ig-like domain-containing protein [Planctomycetota bacterium]|nr:Ig-like domain-containing protein [Planctomycetota bacterium]
MRNALSPLFFVAALAFTSCGGGGDGSSPFRIPCNTGAPFCVIQCDLGCSQTSFSVTEIAENQRLKFRFSDEVDPATVNSASISIRTATGIAPAGDFEVNGPEVVFIPRVTTTAGISSFGFQRNEAYIITLAGGSSIAQSVTNLAGDGLTQELSGTVVASLGILDEDGQPPQVELLAPTQLVNAPVNPTIVLRFSELIDTTPLQVPLSEASPIRVVLRGQLPSGLCDSEAEGTALTGLPQLSTELIGQREVTVVTFTPSVQLPGQSCITVRVTADLRDLSGRSAIPNKFVILTQEGVSTPIEVTETFQDGSQQEPVVSGGTWSGGARPGLIGGDGRHGSFDPTLGVAVGGNIFEWNTDLFVIPAASSLTGQEYTITDGQFFFSDMSVEEGTTIRFTGSIPPVIRVRGDVEIFGTIDINGVDIPGTIQTSGPSTGLRVSTFNARTGTPTTPVMPGTSGGPGGGSGGNGGQESDNVNNLAVCNGQPGEDIQVGASHAYAGSTAGTGGAGSLQQPANGVWATPPALVGPGLGIYCGYFSNGGGGGGFAAPGTGSLAPQHINALYTVAGNTPAAGGAAFSLFPFPPNPLPTGYTSLDHFMVGGSGGGGGGSHGYGLLAVNGNPPTGERWMKGHAGSGGGGTAAIRCGGTMTIAATATLSSRGGAGVVISGDDPFNPSPTDQYGISSPGGGGSGGSFLLQAAKSLSFAGTMDTRGGLGSTVGFISNNLQAMTGGAGDGADGFFRLESDVNVAFGGTAFPAFVAGENSGGLTDRDNLSGDASLWYGTGLVFPPTWERYELDVDTDGDGVVDITYTDSGEPGTQKAYETVVVGNGTVASPVTLPLVIEFQGAELDQSGTTPLPGTIKPWREGIGSGAGPGIQLDSITGFRFRMSYNRGLFPDMAVLALRVYART